MPGFQSDTLVNWPLQPMVRILILFAAGILTPPFLPVSVLLWICWGGLAVFSLGVLVFRRKGRLQRPGLIVAILLFLLGNLAVSFHDVRRGLLYCDVVQLPDATFLVEVLPEPVFRNGSFRFNARLIARQRDAFSWKRTDGALRIFLTADSGRNIRTGDRLFISATARKPSSEKVPGGFSMQHWLAQQGIYATMQVKSGEWKHSGAVNRALMYYAVEGRKKMIGKLEQNGLSGNELAVAGALILGDRTEIDTEVINDYTSSGIIHILAVSGLHVGLIYGALLLMLRMLRRLERSWVALVFILLSLWAYAMLTGLSPSVLRATVMYSFIAIARSGRHPVSPFNALAASAFLLLVVDPYMWKQIGFQLSYAAVWGITAFAPLTRLTSRIPNRLLRYTAVSVAVSAVAQLTTTPLTFFYFGSFPTYFFIANLLAIPLSTGLTYAGILAVVLADVPWLGRCSARLLEYGIWLLNNMAHMIRELPYAKVTGLYITVPVLLLLLFLLVQSVFLVQKRTACRWLVWLSLVACFCAVSFAGEAGRLRSGHYLLLHHRRQLHILVANGTSAIHMVIGRPGQPDSLFHKALESSLSRYTPAETCSGHIHIGATIPGYGKLPPDTEPRWKQFRFRPTMR